MKKTIRTLLGTLAAAGLLLMPLKAEAAEPGDYLHSARIGVLAHDTDINLWGAHATEQGLDLNGELVLSPELEMLGGITRPNMGFTLNTAGDTSKLYGGGLWEYLWQSGWFFDTGVGFAWHDGRGKDLGSRVLLRLAIEVGYSVADNHRLSFLMDHISNANTADPNPGIDDMGLVYSYVF